jgi:hypothetical protein
LIVLFLTACGTANSSEQPQHGELVRLYPGSSLGQTLVARFDGLNEIEIYIESQETGDGQLVLTVWDKPSGSSKKITQSSLPLDEITGHGTYSLAFNPINNSTNEYYYLELAIEGQGSILVGVDQGDVYYNHSLYLNREPTDGQLGFRPHYDPVQLLFGLVEEGLTWAAILTIGLWLFVIPGWAILSLTFRRWSSLNWKVKLGLSAGTSLAIYPVLLLWTDLIGVHLGALYAWLPAAAGTLIILWRNRSTLSRIRPKSVKIDEEISRRNSLTEYANNFEAWLPDVLFLVLLILIIAVRFWHIRNLDAPMWGDSYQHTMIAQLFVDNAGLFTNWEPYVPYYSLTVHFGFPVTAALISWLTSMPILKATLITGQILNVMAVVTLVPLAARFGAKNRWTGIGVLLVAGLLSLMPAFYVNWGRYAQLAGLVILPVALWALWDLGGSPQETGDKRTLSNQLIAILLTGTLIAGMALSYYRMVFYLVFFTIAWSLVWGVIKWKKRVDLWVKAVFTLVGIAAASLTFILPWVLRVSGSNLAGVVAAGISIGSTLEWVLADFQVWREITTYVPTFLLIAGTFALVWAAIRRRWVVFILPLWMLLLTLYIGGQLINLPGANLMQSFAILISLYIPIGLIIGWLIDDSVLLIDMQKSNLRTITIPIILVCLGLWGALNLRSIPQPETYALIRRTDMHAMSWIRENIPPGDRILVEGFTINNASSAVGSDAGWWISLLAERENSMPPQYALMNEVSLPADYSEQVVNLTAALENTNLDTQKALGVLCDHNISHIYIGQGQGKIRLGGQQLFWPQEFEDSRHYELIYHQDRVYIFSITPGACEANP